MSYYNYDGLNWEKINADNWLYWAYLAEAFNERFLNNLDFSAGNFYNQCTLYFPNPKLADIKAVSRSYQWRNNIISNIINLGSYYVDREKILDESKYDSKYGIFMDTPYFTLNELREKIGFADLGTEITDWSLALKCVKKILPLYRYKLYTGNGSQAIENSYFRSTNYHFIDKYTVNIYSADIQGVLQNPTFQMQSTTCNYYLSRNCKWIKSKYTYYTKEETQDVPHTVDYDRFEFDCRFKACLNNPKYTLDCKVEYYVFPYPYAGTGNCYKTTHYYFSPFTKNGKIIWKVGDDTIKQGVVKTFVYDALNYDQEPFINPVINTEFYETNWSYQYTQSILCGLYDFYDSFQLK